MSDPDQASGDRKDDRGGWIFVCHSHKDLEVIRRIRNTLEERGHNPLLFFLRCLDDDSELDELIRREIEAREFFILCDSPNARSSKWVQDEIAIIRSLPNKVRVKLDLEASWEHQLDAVRDLSRRATVFLSYSSSDADIASAIAAALEERDYRVVSTDYRIRAAAEAVSPGTEENFADVRQAIDEALDNGAFVMLLSPDSHYSLSLLDELAYARYSRPDSRVIPVVVGDIKSDDVPLAIWKFDRLDFTEGEFEENVRDLVARLRRPPSAT